MGQKAKKRRKNFWRSAPFNIPESIVFCQIFKEDSLELPQRVNKVFFTFYISKKNTIQYTCIMPYVLHHFDPPSVSLETIFQCKFFLTVH
jgi:hypothetical protein